MHAGVLQHHPHLPQHHHLLDVLDLVVPLNGKVMTGVTMKTTIVDVNGMVETVAEIMLRHSIAKIVYALIQKNLLLDVKIFTTVKIT